jgi:hypothetical protein
LEVHKDQEKPYKCPFENCTKDFSKRLYLQNHHYQHVATAWYQCDQCDKFFYKKCDLKAHCVVHLTERSFLCNECGMSFKSLQYLKLHSTVHLDAKKFACKSCDKRFRKSYSLTLHTRAVHTRELPYVCSTCGKRFNSSNHLVVHTRYHTGERWVYHLIFLLGLGVAGIFNTVKNYFYNRKSRFFNWLRPFSVHTNALNQSVLPFTSTSNIWKDIAGRSMEYKLKAQDQTKIIF